MTLRSAKDAKLRTIQHQEHNMREAIEKAAAKHARKEAWLAEHVPAVKATIIKGIDDAIRDGKTSYEFQYYANDGSYKETLLHLIRIWLSSAGYELGTPGLNCTGISWENA